jgi:2-polyprenyl-6-methoxyphenol hydroxylase-like FAD-dependent oxidoreductase
MREERTEVLVVGAGPVGLWTALLLAEAGIEVILIDQEERTAARSYACALHPQTLARLQRLGLAEALLEQGRRVPTVAFYDHEARRAEIRLSELGGEFPFLLILPQNVLERALEERLRRAGVNVRWNHRFDRFAEEQELVAATIEELGGTSTGYIVPHWEMVVQNRWPLRAQFILGADGHHSLVRQRLGIDYQRVAGPEFFAAYEFVAEAPGEAEVRIVLDEATTNVLWPLPENKSRWTFQLVRSEIPAEFPGKERRAARLAQPVVDERIRQYVQRVARRRAPWFTAGVREVTWCTEVAFEQRLAQPLGRNRCWLLGDAAHQTGPVGVQSMNGGFAEAESLVNAVRNILREGVPLEVLANFSRQQQEQWRRLLGMTGGLKAGPGADPWVSRHSARILPCPPAADDDLPRLVRQLHLELG